MLTNIECLQVKIKQKLSLFEKPIVELWETHNQLIHKKLQYGEITKKEAFKQIKR